MLIDTNLLLLLLLGRFDPKRIGKASNTSRYTKDDYALLTWYVEPFPGLIATPNILTEVSNLCGHWSEPLKTVYFRYLAQEIQKFVERYLPSSSVSLSETFVQHGLTDASISALLREENHLVLTDDLRLYVQLISDGFDAINFNHLREYYLGY